MSPDNYSGNKRIQELIALQEAVYGFGKHVGDFLSDSTGDFRGISVILSNSGGCLAILKRFGEDGTPEVLFASGQTPVEAIAAADTRLADGGWRADKPRPKGK